MSMRIKEVRKKYEGRSNRSRGVVMETELGNKFKILSDISTDSYVLVRCTFIKKPLPGVQAIEGLNVGDEMPFDDDNVIAKIISE